MYFEKGSSFKGTIWFGGSDKHLVPSMHSVIWETITPPILRALCSGSSRNVPLSIWENKRRELQMTVQIIGQKWKLSKAWVAWHSLQDTQSLVCSWCEAGGSGESIFLRVPQGVVRFESKFQAHPDCLWLLRVKTPLHPFLPKTSTGCWWWPDSPVNCQETEWLNLSTSSFKMSWMEFHKDRAWYPD